MNIRILHRPRKMARKTQATSHLAQVCQCGKRQKQTQKDPKCCALQEKWHSTHGGTSPNAAPAKNDTLTMYCTCHVIWCHMHFVTAWRSTTKAICRNRQHHTSKVLHRPRKMNMDISEVLATILRRQCNSIAPVTKTTCNFLSHNATTWFGCVSFQTHIYV